jgi:hypothetical protein
MRKNPFHLTEETRRKISLAKGGTGIPYEHKKLYINSLKETLNTA